MADRVEVHETSIDDKGVASMKKLDTVELKSGQSIELKPAGMHIMFIGLKEPLKEGGVVKAQLKFKKAGDVAVEFAVKTAAPAAERRPRAHAPRPLISSLRFVIPGLVPGIHPSSSSRAKWIGGSRGQAPG